MRGSIVKRGRTDSYVISLGRNADGRKRQNWVGGFRTRKEAKAAAGQGPRPGPHRHLRRRRSSDGRRYLEEWLDGIRPSLRPKTAFSYDDTLRGYVIPRVGSMCLVDLTTTRLRALRRAGGRRLPTRHRRPVSPHGRVRTSNSEGLHDLRHTVATLALTAGIPHEDRPRAPWPRQRLDHLDTSHVAPLAPRPRGLGDRWADVQRAVASTATMARRASAVRSSRQLSLDDEADLLLRLALAIQ
jgi:hypothetical protein